MLKLEHNAKLKAQAHDATTTKGYQILNEGYRKLYEERVAIKSRADKQRRNLRALQEKNDLDGLADDFDSPGGCVTPCPQTPREVLKPPLVTNLPTAPQLNTRKLLDAQGRPAFSSRPRAPPPRPNIKLRSGSRRSWGWRTPWRPIRFSRSCGRRLRSGGNSRSEGK